MRKLMIACCAILLALTPVAAHAATDISGIWTGSIQAPDGGGDFQISFTFKVDGGKLTGTVEAAQGGQGDPIAISDGKVDGDKVSFNIVFNGTTISHEGTVNSAGDEIKLSSKSSDGSFPPSEMTLKRAKPAVSQ
jgi:hypothetical protein